MPNKQPDERIDLTLNTSMYPRLTAELVQPRNMSLNRLGTDQHRRVYHMLAQLGAGAMGEVHLVRDALLRREIAYKQLLSSEQVSATDEQRFISEVKITAQLDHPYIVPIYSLELTDRGPAYTMKRVAGDDLKDWLKELRTGGPDARQHYLKKRSLLLETFLKVCDAMAFAHHRGILHRDLKPANIMIGPYHEVYIMDWGIARPFGEAAEDYLFEEQEKGKVIGTPRYMSPEQSRAANAQLDGRSDLFSLGLILFELLTLQPAYQAQNTQELFDKVRFAKLAAMENLHGAPIPRELQAIVRKATALKRAARYAGVAEMAADLRRYLNGDAILAQPDSPLQTLVRRFKKHRLLALTALMLVVLVSSVLTSVNLYQRQQALKEAQRKELRRTALFTAVVSQSQQIDHQLLRVQHSLQMLAGHAIQALEHGTPDPQEPYYPDTLPDYYQRIPAPFDSSHYHSRLSLERASFANAYNVPPAQLMPQVHLLNPLYRVQPQIFLKTAHDSEHKPGLQKGWRQQIATTGVPLMFTNIVTKEGTYEYYPSIQYNTPNYDPRNRPFYQQALNHREIRCGNTYLDRIAGQLMPCSLAIYDAHEQFMGMVSVDMQFNYLAQHLLDIQNQPAIQETYLLNPAGQIIVKASDKNAQIVKQQQIHTRNKLKTLDDPELQTRLREHQKLGMLENDQRLLLFVQLNFQDWYFVAAVQPQKLYATESASNPR